MHFSTLISLAASIASAQAVSQGFNYGATFSDGSFKQQTDYEADFTRQKNLAGTSGFSSARLYTMIQGGTSDTPSSAFQAAIDTQTSLLLGVWCSAGQATVTNEINALKSAIQQFGSKFADLIVGISVGSEDLYRVSPTGIENDSGLGATPDELVSYIQQVKSAISGTPASGASIGHVDTWTAWVNGSNNAVIEAIDWLGMDSYPYFETTVPNSIGDAKTAFWDSYDKSKSASQGKEVWITETGWPVSGKVSGQAIASVSNAETYWQEVGCSLLGSYNTWWYTLQDAEPTTPNPSFGIVGADLSSDPIYNLSCKNVTTTNSTSSSSTKSGGTHSATGSSGNGTSTAGGHSSSTGTASGSAASATGSGSAASGTSGSGASATSGGSAASSSGTSAQSASGADNIKADSAIGAGILAIFWLVAAL